MDTYAIGAKEYHELVRELEELRFENQRLKNKVATFAVLAARDYPEAVAETFDFMEREGVI